MTQHINEYVYNSFSKRKKVGLGEVQEEESGIGRGSGRRKWERTTMKTYAIVCREGSTIGGFLTDAKAFRGKWKRNLNMRSLQQCLALKEWAPWLALRASSDTSRFIFTALPPALLLYPHRRHKNKRHIAAPVKHRAARAYQQPSRCLFKMTGKGGGGRTNKSRQKRSTGVGPSYHRRVRRKVTGSDAQSIFPRSDSPPIDGGQSERRKRPTAMDVPNTSDMETQPPMTRDGEEPQPRLEQDPEIFLPGPRTPVPSNRDNLLIRGGGFRRNSTVPIRDFQAIQRNGRQPQIGERENETPGGHLTCTSVLDRRRVLGTSNIAQRKSDPSFKIFLENLQRTLLTKFNTVESAIKNLRHEVDSVKQLVTDGMLGMKAGSSSGLRKKSKRSSNCTSNGLSKTLWNRRMLP